MRIILLGLLLALIIGVILLLAAFVFRGKVIDDLRKELAGVDDPMVWLSDEDRRHYARELLERDRTAYQDRLLKEQHEQLKQFNNPTEGSK